MTVLFCRVDDGYYRINPQGRRYETLKEISDSEVVTLTLFQQLRGVESERFGSELLVAPIYNSQGQRPVYLPSGRWVDYWTREVIEGPRMQHVEATLDTLPLYVRADALVPTAEPQDHLTEVPFEMVTFDCYLIAEGTFELRDTDGVTRVEASFEGTRLEIALEGAKQKIGLHLIPLPDAPQVETVRANDSDLEMVESLRLDLNSGVGWTSDPDGAVRVVVG